MSQCLQVVLVLIAAIVIAFLVSWENGGISNQGTSGRFELVDPTCEDVPVLCATPPGGER